MSFIAAGMTLAGMLLAPTTMAFADTPSTGVNSAPSAVAISPMTNHTADIQWNLQPGQSGQYGPSFTTTVYENVGIEFAQSGGTIVYELVNPSTGSVVGSPVTETGSFGSGTWAYIDEAPGTYELKIINMSGTSESGNCYVWYQ